VTDVEVSYFVDARYAHQVWLIEVPLGKSRLTGPDDLQDLGRSFDQVHRRLFAVAEPGARVEILTWKARVRAPVGRRAIETMAAGSIGIDTTIPEPRIERDAFFDGEWHRTPVFTGGTIGAEVDVHGPAIVEEPTSTLVVPPGACLRATTHGNYHVEV